MMRLLRSEGTGKLIAGGIVIAITIIFVLEFQATQIQKVGKIQHDCSVEVAGDCVSIKEFFSAYGLIVPRGMAPKQIKALALRQRVLEGLVERQLLLQDAERLGIAVGDQQVDDELEIGRAHVSLPGADAAWLAYPLGLGPELVRVLPVRSAQTKQFDYEIYQRVVRAYASRSPKEFKAMQERELVAQRMRDLVKARVRVSVEEAYRAYQQENEKATVRVVQLKRSWFGKYAVDTSETAVEGWAKAHAQEVDEAWKNAKDNWKAGCALVSEVFVRVPPSATDEDKARGREAIDKAATRISQGETFEAVAKDASESESAVLGGEVGCIGLSLDAASKEKEAAELPVGKTSDPIEVPTGYLLLRRHGTLAAADVDKIGRRTVAKRLAVRFLADETAQTFGQAVRKKVEAGVSLEDAVNDELSRLIPKSEKKKAKKGDEEPTEPPALLSLDRPRLEVSAPFPRGGNPVPNAKGPESPAAIAFGLEKADALYPKFIETLDGFAMFQLKEKTTVSREDFDKEKDGIVRSLLVLKQADALRDYVARLRKKVETKIVVNAQLAEEKGSTEG